MKCVGPHDVKYGMLVASDTMPQPQPRKRIVEKKLTETERCRVVLHFPKELLGLLQQDAVVRTDNLL